MVDPDWSILLLWQSADMVFEGAIGQWWLAGSPDEQWAGWIGLDPDNATPWHLTLDGSPVVESEAYSAGATFHGRTSRGDFTLLYSHFSRSSRSNNVNSEVWRGSVLLQGRHVDVNQQFTSASFELPNLIDWVGPTPLSHHNQPPVSFDLGESGEIDIQLAANLDTGETLHLHVLQRETFGRTKRAKSAYASYLVGDGITIERADQISLALARLHAILDTREIRAHSMALASASESTFERVEVVDTNSPLDRELKGLHDPFIDTSDVDFAQFLPRWFALNEKAMAAVAAAAPDGHGGYVSTRLMDVCNGLEHLARLLMPTPTLTEKESDALTSLRDVGVAKDLRRTIKQTFLARHLTLEMKLVGVAETIGIESARWLLGDDLRQWGYTVARLRNAIAHGLVLEDGMVEDIPFTITALRSVTAVLRLALLVEAGYSAASGTPGELLWDGNLRAVAHPNSEFWYELEDLSRLRDAWPVWRSRIDQTGST